MTKSHPTTTPDPRLNQILAALPAADYARLRPELELVEMPRGWTMSESGDHVTHLHFPTSGIVSLVYALEDGASSEIALVGNEGLIGISIYMGGESLPSSTEVQCAGQAYRLSRRVMKREFALGGQLQHLALLYTQALIVQTSQMAVCNQHHAVEQRLARWILMSMDRLHSHKMSITQERISLMLGVRRESITVAAGALQKDGMIERTRGVIKLVDRPRLEERVCECYLAVKHECERLMAHAGTPRSDA
ncbi:Crp/Fnr family transcriptional regulator [Curvibacter sp. RS43]|uniref:Crp/Fnr family transcriptional regulator n=1 Tax=Curvibacter microcysteis TaxID=3026419 RepID=UPI002362419D|nr:Crp/Fnr family transcriptional regulator [Curvibacter sp. RS43]MDD0808999.1 Crp/Fnr family transcriptional regulator [Curvibacter sp. RS43]